MCGCVCVQSSHGRSDEAVAQEALANHARCNNSAVYDLFQALYRSSLTCPNCRRQSNTFDPFLSVSLPIPQKTRRPVYVTVVYYDARPKQVRIGLLMNQGDTVRELRHTLATDTKIPEAQVGSNVITQTLTLSLNTGHKVHSHLDHFCSLNRMLENTSALKVQRHWSILTFAIVRKLS